MVLDKRRSEVLSQVIGLGLGQELISSKCVCVGGFQVPLQKGSRQCLLAGSPEPLSIGWPLSAAIFLQTDLAGPRFSISQRLRDLSDLSYCCQQ